jgi:hypothetical protein
MSKARKTAAERWREWSREKREDVLQTFLADPNFIAFDCASIEDEQEAKRIVDDAVAVLRDAARGRK